MTTEIPQLVATWRRRAADGWSKCVLSPEQTAMLEEHADALEQAWGRCYVAPWRDSRGDQPTFNWRERLGNIIDHAARLGPKRVQEAVISLLYEFDATNLAAAGRFTALEALLVTWRVRARKQVLSIDSFTATGDVEGASECVGMATGVAMCVDDLETVVAGLRADPAQESK